MILSFSRSRRPERYLASSAISLLAIAQALPRPTIPGTLSVPDAAELRPQLHARIFAANIQRAHALRSVKLVRRDGGDVHVVLNDVEGHLANRLHRVGMKEHAALVT